MKGESMKIYNIKDTKNFFEHLKKCEGTVELVNDKGKLISIFDRNYNNYNEIAATYSQGAINEIELRFQNSQDSVTMLNYLVAM